MNGVSMLLAILVSRWTRSFAGIAVASMIVWYLGPLVPGMNGPLPRALAILALVMLWGVVNSGLSWRRRRRQKALAASITGEGGRDAREAQADAAEEVAQLREKMQHALSRLHRRWRGRHLYEQPWFVLIGPPGSGKTTALLNSGLHFPLAEDSDAPSVGGVGGTRLCDWWFADEAVLIDTAGRYTTQDSDAVVDRAGWQGFLDLLRRTRPRQPINGVIVVLSLVDLAAAEPEARAAHARSVRLRINEITERLRMRVPVYVMFSKADQLRGFNAYFDDLDAAGRAQVWGATFPVERGVDGFLPEFRLLLERLEQRLVERLQAERAAERRALIGSFPTQVASLEQPLAEFLTLAFSGSRLDPAPFLRGVYMTSATQEGTPIDRLTGMLARSFGIDQQRAPSLRPVNGRSYFVTVLLRDVILGEALLIARRPGRWRRRGVLRAVGFSAVGVATLTGALLLWRIEAANRLAIARTDEAIAAYRQLLAGQKLDPVGDDDFTRVAPLLDAAAGLPRDGSGAPYLFGLSQEAKLAQSGRLAYERALQRILLPRLVWRLEQQMRSRFDDADFLYAATRVYLMLGSAGPLDPALVRAWMTADWESRYPGTLNAALRAHLLAHLNALLSTPLPPITLDGGLVEAARATFSRVSLAARVYGRIRAEANAKTVPDWTPARAVGPAGSEVFTRPSGRPLTDGIPGLFTAAGFHDVLLRDLPATTRAVADESWVLGHTQAIPAEGPALASLETDVVALYLADAEKAWDALLDDIALAPLGGQRTAVQTLYVLSSPQSPLRDLLTAVVRELRAMTQVEGKDAAPENGRSASPIPGVATAAAATRPSPAMQDFAAHFQPLIDLVGTGGQAPLDTVLHLINALQQELAAATPGNTNLPAALQGSGDPVQLLLAEAGRQPAPLARWLRQTAVAGNAMLGTAEHAALSATFSGGDGPGALCRSVVDGRFPFDPRSGQDAPIDDFSRLFAPGGQLDSYFQTQLKPFVDMSGTVWRPHGLGDAKAPVDAATVTVFQRAAAIRDAFFPAGGTGPQIRFTLTPASSGAEKATLALGNTSIATDTPRTASFTWPGNDGMSDAGLHFGTAADAAPALQASGPWALFRFLAQGRLSPGGGQETYALAFAAGGHQASFILQAASARNPFAHDLLRGFRCPVVR